MSIIFQEPRIALHPTICVGEQIADVLRVHDRLAAKGTVLELMRRTGLAPALHSAYPHEMSGGELQRVSIAQALACEPSLIVADEPTASLDAITQSEILDLFRGLKTGMLFISHHPSTLRAVANRVCVMYAGEIVERGTLDEVFTSPLHPYTRALFDAMPPAPGAATKRLPAIPGDFSAATRPRVGCAFAPRCALARSSCSEERPVSVKTSESREVLCSAYEN
jgi:peptide/nickel transport system ATP-binding protein